MPNRPSGTVTFLFTDIEGSTRLWDEHPAAMGEGLSIHDRILRTTVEGHGGYVFSTAGDAFAVAFADPRLALRAALEAQKQFASQEWPHPIVIRVRMALHSGITAERGGDYFGTAPNRCARVMAVAFGGQVLLTEATNGMLKDHRPEGVSFRDLGQHQLRDLVTPERIFAVVHPDLVPTPETIRSLTTLPNNLPLQLTSFVGRTQELEELSMLIRRSRLVTVAGVGGSGKTRLALQAAADALDDHPDGVWMVELAPVAEPDGVIRAVAAVLGVPEPPDRPLQQAVVDHLRHRDLLVILDNCEHLIDTVARLVDQLMASAPRLRVLTTSRELLGVPGEVPYQLRSMEVPDEDMTMAGMAEFDAVRLFVARGEAASAVFQVNQANAATIVQLCRRLDGMPLALELAAARLRVLSPEQIAARLDDRFRLLTGGSRTALPRQQTLQAAIDWSYELLSEQERVTFDRLSAFQGGFTLEGAEAVCVGDPIDHGDVLDLVSHLVDKSLIAAGPAPDGIRYRILETLRQYGRERLASRGETEPVRQRHAVYFRSLVEEALPHLRGPDEEMWLDRLEVEHDNFRQALRWTIDAYETDLGQGLAGTLYRFWMIRHHHIEGSEWLNQVLTLGSGAHATHGRALLGAGTLALYQGKAEAGRQHLERAVTALQEAGEEQLQLAALNNLGDTLIDFGEHAAAARMFEQELTVARATNDSMSAAFALMNLGFIEVVRGHYEEAAARIRDSADTARESGSRELLGSVLTQAIFGSIDMSDLEAAQRYVEEIVALGSHPTAPGRHFVVSGIVAGRLGGVDAGIGLMQQGIKQFRTIPGYRQISALLDRVFAEWAGLEFARGKPHRGIVLLAAAQGLRPGKKRYPHLAAVHENWIATARQSLEPVTFEQAWRRGASMTVDQLIDFVLEETASDPSGPDRS